MLLTNSLVDYNSWIESDKARALVKTLDKDTVVVEGRKSLLLDRIQLTIMP
jgi:hypothetical protein